MSEQLRRGKVTSAVIAGGHGRIFNLRLNFLTLCMLAIVGSIMSGMGVPGAGRPAHSAAIVEPAGTGFEAGLVGLDLAHARAERRRGEALEQVESLELLLASLHEDGPGTERRLAKARELHDYWRQRILGQEESIAKLAAEIRSGLDRIEQLQRGLGDPELSDRESARHKVVLGVMQSRQRDLRTQYVSLGRAARLFSDRRDRAGQSLAWLLRQDERRELARAQAHQSLRDAEAAHGYWLQVTGQLDGEREELTELRRAVAMADALALPREEPPTFGETAGLRPQWDARGANRRLAATRQVRTAPNGPGGDGIGEQDLSDNEARVALRPVEGEVVSRFDDASRGRFDHGIVVRTAGGERVIAPRSGAVIFAGELQGYGLLLIIEHGDGYHTLLAGLGRLVVRAGMYVKAGQLMGSLAEDEQGEGQLYLELRRRGEPVNPLPWLAAHSDKVRG